MTPEAKLATARLWCVKNVPYLHHAFRSLIPHRVDSETFDTFGITKRGVLLWSPKAVERWSIEEIGTVIMHELCHFIRDHHGRVGRRAFKLWNIAGDFEINDDLKEEPWQLPEGGLLPEQLELKEGLIAEEYYNLLQEMADEIPEDFTGGFGDSTEGCGSGAGGKDLEEEPSDEECEGQSGAEVALIRKEAAEAVKAEAAKGTGTVSGNWSRWADEMLKPPKVRWQDILERSVSRSLDVIAGNTDSSFDKPARRQGVYGWEGGLILPRDISYRPTVALVIDTSGSMGLSELQRCASEAKSILKGIDAELITCTCDSVVQGIKEIEDMNDLKSIFTGGGGTDFRPPLEALDKHHKRPDIIIFATDGGGPAPAKPPKGIELIWLLVGNHRQVPWVESDYSNQVNYGKFIHVEE
jgi:predicted metal-dependent peptidase